MKIRFPSCRTELTIRNVALLKEIVKPVEDKEPEVKQNRMPCIKATPPPLQKNNTSTISVVNWLLGFIKKRLEKSINENLKMRNFQKIMSREVGHAVSVSLPTKKKKNKKKKNLKKPTLNRLELVRILGSLVWTRLIS